MPRLGEEAVQDEIANSLLGDVQEPSEAPPEEQGYFGGSDAVDLLNSAVEDQRANRIQFGDSITPEEAEPTNDERLADLQTDRNERARKLANIATREELEEVGALKPSEQAQPEQNAQSEPATPEQVIQHRAQLDSFIQENQLSDPLATKDLAIGLSEVFEVDRAQVNEQLVGNTFTRLGVSALDMLKHVYDGGQLQPVPQEGARYFMDSFLRMLGVADPRQHAGRFNEPLLATIAISSAMNFLDTAMRNPGVTDLSQLNSGDGIEWTRAKINEVFGQEVLTWAQAAKLADMSGKFLLNLLSKVQRIQPRQQTQSRTARAPRVAGGRVRGMRTNTDIFDRSTLEYYQQQHGRL